MPPRARVLLAVAAVATWLVACSALLGVTPPPDVLDGGPADGALPPTDGGGPDAGADTTTGDGAADGGSDATSPDGGGDAFAPDAYWTFSDDFERGDFTRWSNAVAVTVVDAGAFAGCCAMHAVVPAGAAGSTYAIVRWTQAPWNIPAVTAGTVAMRARIKATELDQDTRELSLLQGFQAPQWYANAGLGGVGGGFSWGYILTDPSHADGGFIGQSGNVVADALGGWHCVELVVNVSAASGHLAIFLDDKQTPDLQGDTNTAVDVGWDSVSVGLGFASGATTSDVLVDDVKIALYTDLSRTIHVGCK